VVTRLTMADWQQGQDALRQEVQRVTALLRSIENPSVPAVGTWNLGEVAVQLSQAWLLVTCLAQQDLAPFHTVIPRDAGVAAGAVVKDMWDWGNVTSSGLASDAERNLTVLADRIDELAEKYFSRCAGQKDFDAPRQWIIEGAMFDQATLTYHALNETVVHGYDIARAAGRRWRIEPTHAAMVLARFIVPVLRAADPRVFVNGAKAAGLRATYDVRIRGGETFHFVFDDGALTVEDPSPRKIDCHISADPVAFLLVVWARQSQWSAIARGKLMAWGRKPWLGFQLRSLIRNP
jgi:SCP-2 sterol transfer family